VRSASIAGALARLDSCLEAKTFLVGDRVSLADVCVAAAVERCCETNSTGTNTRRWLATVSAATGSSQESTGPTAAAAGSSAAKAQKDQKQQKQAPKKEKEQKKKDSKKSGGGGGGGGGASERGGKNDKGKTKLGLQFTREGDFASWYPEVVEKSEMLSYGDVSGCYILRPWGYAVWEHIQEWFDTQIKLLGVDNCYFPLFVAKVLNTCDWLCHPSQQQSNLTYFHRLSISLRSRRRRTTWRASRPRWRG
jgi:hypothetical protein